MSKKISLNVIGEEQLAAAEAAQAGPKSRAEGGTVFDEIDAEVKANAIMLYMKGTPNQPMCGFSARAVEILRRLEQPFATVNILEDPEKREAIKQYSEWPTIPQLYVKGEFVGGSDIMLEMFQSGELGELVAG
jgi:monothiol glutaredoxin